MPLMAFQASGDLLVSSVTAITKQFSMPAGFGLHLLSHFGVAGEAFFSDRFERITQRFQWLVGIPVTMKTVLQLIMGQIAMTIIASDYGFDSQRRMLRMTIQTAHCCPVLSAKVGQRFLFRHMTLDTVLLLQLFPCR